MQSVHSMTHAVQNWRPHVGLQRTSEQTTSLRGLYNLGAQDCFVHRFYTKKINKGVTFNNTYSVVNYILFSSWLHQRTRLIKTLIFSMWSKGGLSLQGQKINKNTSHSPSSSFKKIMTSEKGENLYLQETISNHV